MIKSFQELFEKQACAQAGFYSDKVRISIGYGTCGQANGATEVFASIKDVVKECGLKYKVCKTGCVGFCQMEPIVDVLVPGMPRVFYHHMSVVS